MVRISFLLPALSWRVTSVWSPKACCLPASIYSFSTPCTDANGWKWESSCLRVKWGFLEFKDLRHVYSPSPSFYCLMNVEQDNHPLMFSGRMKLIELLKKPPWEPPGWHIKLLPMSEIGSWPHNQVIGDLESSSWPNWLRKKAGLDFSESQTFRAAKDLRGKMYRC